MSNNNLRGSFLNSSTATNGQKTVVTSSTTYGTSTTQPLGLSTQTPNFSTTLPGTTNLYSSFNPSIYSSSTGGALTGLTGTTGVSGVPNSYIQSSYTSYTSPTLTTGTTITGISAIRQSTTTTTGGEAITTSTVGGGNTNLASQYALSQPITASSISGLNSNTTTTVNYTTTAPTTSLYTSEYIQELLNKNKLTDASKTQEQVGSSSTLQVTVPASGLTLSQNNDTIQAVSSSNNLYSSSIANPIYTNNLTTSTNYERYSPLKQSTNLGLTSSAATNYRVEMKAQLKYLSHMKEELQQKQSEYQKDISGLLTGMKKEMEVEFEKTLDSVSSQQSTNLVIGSSNNTLLLQQEIDTLQEKLLMAVQLNETFKIKISNLEKTVDSVSHEKITLQSSVLDLDQIKSELTIVKTENEALRQSQTGGAAALTEEIKFIEQQYLGEKDKNHKLVNQYSEQILQLNEKISSLENQILLIQKESSEKTILITSLQKEKEIILIEKNTLYTSLIEKQTIIENNTKEIIHISSGASDQSENQKLRDQISSLLVEINQLKLNSNTSAITTSTTITTSQNDYSVLIADLKKDIEEKAEQLGSLRTFVQEVQMAGQAKVIERELQLQEKDKIIQSQKDELLLLSKRLETVIHETNTHTHTHTHTITESVRIDPTKSERRERKEVEVQHQKEIPQDEFEGEEGEEQVEEEEIEFNVEVKPQRERVEEDKQGFSIGGLGKDLLENQAVQDALSKEKDGLSKQVTDLNNKYLNAQRENNEKIAQYQKQEKELKDQIKKLQETVDSLTKQNQDKEAQFNKQQSIKITEERTKVTSEFELKLKTETDSKNTLEAKVTELTQQIATLEQRLKDEKTQHEIDVKSAASSNNSELVFQYETKITNIAHAANSEKTGLEIKINELNHKITLLEQKLIDEKSIYEASLIKSSTTSQQESQAATKQLEEKHHQAIIVIQQNHQQEITTLNIQLNEQKAKLESELFTVQTQLKSQISSLELRIVELQNELSQASSKLGHEKSVLEAKINELNLQISLLEQKLVDAKSSHEAQLLQSTSSHNNTSTQLQASYEIKINEIQKTFSEERIILESKNTQLTAEVATLKERLNEEKKQSEIRITQVLQSQSSSSSDLISQHETRVTELQNNFTHQRSTLEARIAELSNQLSVLEQKLRDEKNSFEIQLNQSAITSKSAADQLISNYEAKLSEQSKSYEQKIAESNKAHLLAIQEAELKHKKEITEIRSTYETQIITIRTEEGAKNEQQSTSNQQQLLLKIYEEREIVTKQLEEKHTQSILIIQSNHTNEITALKTQFNVEKTKLEAEILQIQTTHQSQISALELKIRQLNEEHHLALQKANEENQKKIHEIELHYKVTITTIEENHSKYIVTVQENHKKEISLVEQQQKNNLSESEKSKFEAIEAQYKQRISSIEAQHKLELEQIQKQNATKISNLEKEHSLKIEETIRSYKIQIEEIQTTFTQKISIITKEKNELSTQNSISSRGQVDKETQLQKEITDLKIKNEQLVAAHQKELLKQEERYNQLRLTVQQISSMSSTTTVTKTSSSSSQQQSSSSSHSSAEYLLLLNDFNRLKEVNNENLKKIQEERRLYGILQEDFKKIEQQLLSLNNSKKTNEKKSKVTTTTVESVSGQTVTSTTSNTNVAVGAVSSTTTKNKAYFEVDQRITKELELQVLKLKEENAVIRDQLKKEYEDQIFTLKEQATEYERSMDEYERVKIELKVFKDEQEEAEWDRARKSSNTKGAKEEQPKKSGLEKEKEELQKVLENKSTQLRKITNDYKKLEKQYKTLQTKVSSTTTTTTTTSTTPAVVESLPTINTEENEPTKKGGKKGNKQDDDLSKIIQLADIIYLINKQD